MLCISCNSEVYVSHDTRNFNAGTLVFVVSCNQTIGKTIFEKNSAIRNVTKCAFEHVYDVFLQKCFAI